MPKDAAITGWAACLLAGAAWCDGLASDGVTRLPVPVVVGPRGGMRRGPDVRVSFERLPEWEVWTRYGVRVVRPERAVFDEMRAVGQREALVVLLDGRRLGEVDIIDVESGAVIEVDGADHRTARRQAWDITKEERLRAAGSRSRG